MNINFVDVNNHDVLKLIMPLLEAIQSLVESEKNCCDNNGRSNRMVKLNTSLLNAYLNFLDDTIKEIKI